ncbi:MAG: hypothetical protein BIFFINMI_01756 [Phycisphaerae bacterium]|nr:hypothetical protein [Phycisphaerae bacterium]
MAKSFLGVRAKPGQVAYGSFTLDDVHIPVVVAAGAKEGPTLALHCAQHATEYPGSAMIGPLLAGLDLATQRGTVVALPLVNIPYVVRTRLPNAYARQDRSNDPIRNGVEFNINRVWPGQPDRPEWNHRLAHALTGGLLKDADAVLDYHSCRMCDPDFAGCSKGHAPSRALALATGLVAIDEVPEEGHFPGQMYRRLPIEFGTAVNLIEMAPTSLKTQFDKMQQARRIAVNVMKHLGMIAGQPELPPVQIVFHRLSEQYTLTAGEMGFATFYQPEAAAVRKGDLICEVRSLKDFSVLERHVAACDGGVASVGPVESHVVLPGEELATLQPGAEIIRNAPPRRSRR